MDTTLITFHLRTLSSTQSVHLIGSWDKFTRRYPMEHDIRRSHNQWRGCYKFKDIICDGETGTSVKRNGGLKMGSMYYYYYELDDGTEIHDTSVPFTTTCPMLPGQPVNLLSVPVEVHPLRYRSASLTSLATESKMTMNPADKFMAPRAPPPRPSLNRLKTAPALTKKRSARSISPKPSTPVSIPKSPWSPKAFFGLLSTSPSLHEVDKRGRSESEVSDIKVATVETYTSFPSLAGRLDQVRVRAHSQPREVPSYLDDKKNGRSLSHPRDVPSMSFRRPQSREPSPLRHSSSLERNNYNTTVLVIPDEIEEDDAEDDANFAEHLHRISLLEKSILTPLAPTPSVSRFPRSNSNSGTSTPTTSHLSKPLPLLPEELELTIKRVPLPLNAAEMPRSHFSTSTISTNMSPTDSQFSYSPSLADDEDTSLDIGSGDDSTYSPVADVDMQFTGYSLPDVEYSSGETLSKLSSLGQVASRATFGNAVSGTAEGGHERTLSALQELLSEMGYLGDFVTGK